MPRNRLAAWFAPILFVFALAAGGASGRVWVVNDGANGAAAAIRLQGPILKGGNAELEAALRQVQLVAKSTINGVPFITVELDSPGGDVVEALDMGRTIYQNFLMTLVRPGHECVSACVFVLMAGAVHTPEDGSSVGLHRPLLVSWSHIDSREAHARYDGLMEYLRQYFRKLGVADAAFDMMMRTDPDTMRYFSQAEMERLRLRGEDPAWEQFYSTKWDAANAPPKAAAPIDRAPVDLTGMPKLPPVDRSYRSVVYMPGSASFGQEYRASLDLPKSTAGWLPFDDGAWRPLFKGVDLLGMARSLAGAVASWVAPAWWLFAIAAFELVRARPWPGHPGADRRRRDQWRLAGLISRASAEAPGPA